MLIIKIRQLRIPQYERSDNKRTPEFVGKIPAIIDYGPNQSIRLLTRYIGILVFLIRQAGRKSIKAFSISYPR